MAAKWRVVSKKEALKGIQSSRWSITTNQQIDSMVRRFALCSNVGSLSIGSDGTTMAARDCL